MKPLGTAFVWTVLLMTDLSGHQQVFRSSANAVVVDVSVTSGRHPVTDLKTTDFELFDNNVRQTIDEAEVDSAALSISVLLDQSGSTSGLYEDRLLRAARDVTNLIHGDDDAELITFGRDVHRSLSPLADLRALTPPRIGDGGTKLFDAVVAALLERPESGHRRLIIVLTDGLDTRSVIDRSTRKAVLEHSNAVVDMIAISIAGRTSNWHVRWPENGRLITYAAGDYDYLLREITDATSGHFYDLRPKSDFIDSLRSSIEQFRQRYSLRFRPTGVSTAGWHELTVRVKSGSYDVHARRGYFGK